MELVRCFGCGSERLLLRGWAWLTWLLGEFVRSSTCRALAMLLHLDLVTSRTVHNLKGFEWAIEIPVTRENAHIH